MLNHHPLLKVCSRPRRADSLMTRKRYPVVMKVSRVCGANGNKQFSSPAVASARLYWGRPQELGDIFSSSWALRNNVNFISYVPPSILLSPRKTIGRPPNRNQGAGGYVGGKGSLINYNYTNFNTCNGILRKWLLGIGQQPPWGWMLSSLRHCNSRLSSV